MLASRRLPSALRFRTACAKDNARAGGLATPNTPPRTTKRRCAPLAKIGLPAVLKTRTLGYDGHGQLVLKTEADIEKALPMLAVPCILEHSSCPSISKPASCWSPTGAVSSPSDRNVHRDGILDLCFVPAGDGRRAARTDGRRRRAVYADVRLPGILAIEFFVKGEFFFNEKAAPP